MEITEEMLIAIASRAKQFAISKFGSDPDYISFDLYNNEKKCELTARYYNYRTEEYDTHNLTVDELSQDLEEVARLRIIAEQELFEKEKIRKAKEEEQKRINDEFEEQKTYLRLKNKFERNNG